MKPTRRGFLGLLASLPFVGKIIDAEVPKPIVPTNIETVGLTMPEGRGQWLCSGWVSEPFFDTRIKAVRDYDLIEWRNTFQRGTYRNTTQLQRAQSSMEWNRSYRPSTKMTNFLKEQA